MPRFEVVSRGAVIGHSDLEAGDPPMGVASGLFVPTEAYASVRSDVLRSAGCHTPNLQLAVRLQGGEALQCTGGVVIEDYSGDIGGGIQGAEVSVLGIPHATYGRLFPAHVAAYQRLGR